MNKANHNLEIGHRASGILKFQIPDFTILDFKISDSVNLGEKEVRP